MRGDKLSAAFSFSSSSESSYFIFINALQRNDTYKFPFIETHTNLNTKQGHPHKSILSVLHKLFRFERRRSGEEEFGIFRKNGNSMRVHRLTQVLLHLWGGNEQKMADIQSLLTFHKSYITQMGKHKDRENLFLSLTWAKASDLSTSCEKRMYVI